MAEARQCDRCGKFYGIAPHSGDFPRDGFNITEFKEHFASSRVDLCDDCYSKLVEFLGKENKE